jgi:hypothetical protein
MMFLRWTPSHRNQVPDYSVSGARCSESRFITKLVVIAFK